MEQTESANQVLINRLSERYIQALIFDLDGVVTPTAEIHARAWKKMFDAYLSEKGLKDGKTYKPLDIASDYPQYLDGISRIKGIRNFLSSRQITLPEGSAQDGPEAETMMGLGNLKNRFFLETLEQQGIEAFPDTVQFIRSQKVAGRRIALISASKNCREILKAANSEDLFEVRVDGLAAEELHLKTKPEPDLFHESARQLQISPENAAVFEDSRAGVKAGKAGGFALVTGVNRGPEMETKSLLQSGADLVISHF